jgi:hypothetical protein
MIGTLLIAYGIIAAIALFEKYINRIESWADRIIGSIKAIKAKLYLKIKNGSIKAKIKIKVKGRYTPEKRTSSETIDIDDIPDDIKRKLLRGDKVEVKRYA